MYPVTSPVTACRHVAPASVARHGTQVPHPSTPRHSHTQTDDTQATQPCASARVHGRGPGPGGRARGGQSLTSRCLLCIVGCVRQLDPRDHGAGGAAEQIRRPVQQGRPPQVPCSHAPAPQASSHGFDLTWLIECGVC